MKVNVNMFHGAKNVNCWSSAVLNVSSVILNLISLLIATRIWCFRSVVYDLGGTGLKNLIKIWSKRNWTALENNISRKSQSILKNYKRRLRQRTTHHRN